MQRLLELLSSGFVTILNMSITASVIITFVFAARFCLKRVPRGFSYALWAVVLFRLLCPISFELPIAVVGVTGVLPTEETQASTMQYIPQGWNAVQREASVENTTTQSATDTELTLQVDGAVESAQDETSVFTIHWSVVASLAWVCGVLALAGVNAHSLYQLKKRLRSAQPYPLATSGISVSNAFLQGQENRLCCIYQSEAIHTPFVLGVLRPRIYLPAHLSIKEQSYILQHEQTHIARHDPLWQALAFLALCLHWFNPLVWLAFKANQKDMELSCDERVLRQMGSEIKKEYAQSLLNLSRGKLAPLHHVLAFGESDAKSRIKNVLSYRKTMFWVSCLASFALVVAVVLLLANPMPSLETNLQEVDAPEATAVPSITTEAQDTTAQAEEDATLADATEDTYTPNWDGIIEEGQYLYAQYFSDADGDGTEEVFVFITSVTDTAMEAVPCEVWCYHNGIYEKLMEAEVCDIVLSPEDETETSPQWVALAQGKAFCFATLSDAGAQWNIYTIQDGAVIAADPVAMTISQDALAEYFIYAITEEYGENNPMVSHDVMLTQTDLDKDGNTELWMMVAVYKNTLAYVFEVQQDGTASVIGRISILPYDTQVMADTTLYQSGDSDVLYFKNSETTAVSDGAYLSDGAFITEYFIGMENNVLTYTFLYSTVGFADAEDTYKLGTGVALTKDAYEAQKQTYLQGVTSGSAQLITVISDYAQGDVLQQAVNSELS